MKYDIVYIKVEKESDMPDGVPDGVVKELPNDDIIPVNILENVHVFTEDELKERDKDVKIAFGDLIWMASKWGKEWFDTETWKKLDNAKNVYNEIYG
jgi:hypothetical protein